MRQDNALQVYYDNDQSRRVDYKILSACRWKKRSYADSSYTSEHVCSNNS